MPTQFGLKPVLAKAFWIESTRALFVKKHSEPPLRIVALPDFRHKTAASDVTLGRDS